MKKEKRDYKEYIQSPEWQETRTRFFNSGIRSEYCMACGLPREPGFHVHHRTYRRLGAEYLRDLILLCPRCHSDLHRQFKECGTCAKPFDGVEAAKAAREGRAFVHECGRVLVREK
jgi:5-methylcytosine-specific restriction endonuclease McrA